MSRLDNSMYSEDAESDASEVAVAKMIAKALGDENRWTEMSAAELYAELESDDTERADVVKDVAKMVYGVELAENIVYEEITLEDDQDFTDEFGILGSLSFIIFLFYAYKKIGKDFTYILVPLLVAGFSLFSAYMPFFFVLISCIYVELKDQRSNQYFTG